MFSTSQVCCLGWGINFVDTNKAAEQVKTSLVDIISRNPQTQAVDIPPDLPLELALIDVETSLPKLSPLSSGGIE